MLNCWNYLNESQIEHLLVNQRADCYRRDFVQRFSSRVQFNSSLKDALCILMWTVIITPLTIWLFNTHVVRRLPVMAVISLNEAHWRGHTRWRSVTETDNEEEYKFDPHLFVLPALIPLMFVSLDTEGEYRWWGVMWSPLLITQSFRLIVNILYPKQPYTHTHTPYSPFNLLSSWIILVSPSLRILNVSVVSTPCSVCLSIFLSFSALTLFFLTRSFVKGLCCNCTKAQPAETLSPPLALHWFIWLKAFYSLSKWLREPLGPNRIECLWQIQ